MVVVGSEGYAIGALQDCCWFFVGTRSRAFVDGGVTGSLLLNQVMEMVLVQFPSTSVFLFRKL